MLTKLRNCETAQPSCRSDQFCSADNCSCTCPLRCYASHFTAVFPEPVQLVCKSFQYKYEIHFGHWWRDERRRQRDHRLVHWHSVEVLRRPRDVHQNRSIPEYRRRHFFALRTRYVRQETNFPGIAFVYTCHTRTVSSSRSHPVGFQARSMCWTTAVKSIWIWETTNDFSMSRCTASTT